MSQSIEMTVSLKIPDVTALTARRTLRGPMGYGEQLADLTRADWWRLILNVPDEEAALTLGRELAEQTNLFVNPNKHVYRLAARTQAREQRQGLAPVSVLTGFHDSPQAALALDALQGRLGYGARVQGLERGTLWTYWLTEADPQRCRELAETMTVTTTRHSGLLANPHSQWWRLV